MWYAHCVLMKSRAPVPSCIPTVLSKSAPAIHRVGVRLSSDCMSRFISSLNWILLYAPSRSIATATASYFLWNYSFTSYANAAAFYHMFTKGIVIESADFMTCLFWTLSLTFVSRVNFFFQNGFTEEMHVDCSQNVCLRLSL